jgi:4-hydroxy-3-polyprenylbenzoate decarboxylase
MAFHSLQEFVARLEERGQLKRISAPVSAELEITEITDRVSKGLPGGNVALLFENVRGHDLPVLINAYGSAQRMAWALGVNNLDELGHRLSELLEPRLPQGLGDAVDRAAGLWGALRSVGLRPRLIKDAPCQEIVHTADSSLNMLPILKCWPKDGGRYITLPQVITRDPATHIRNVGMYRLQQTGSRTLAMHWQRHKGGAEHERVAREQKKETIPAAIALGGDPAQTWCASAPLPPDIDEYLLAGWLRGSPVQFVRAITQPIEVPAEADIVIEGYVDPNEHKPEGPFGDHTGFYTPVELFPVFYVTAITRRRDAIYPATVVGRPPMEDYWMGKATERLFLPLIRLFQSEIVDINMPAEGVFHNMVIVGVKKRFPGHPRKVMYGLWGLGLMMLSKAIVVVDHDVNVHDLSEVAWRVLGNVDWQRDVVIVEGPVDDLDHSAVRPALGGKIGIDATAKGPEDGHPRGWPEEIRMLDQIKALVDRRWQEYGFQPSTPAMTSQEGTP